MIVTTQFLVLEKRPYRESALIIRGVSPDCGRASFVVHGAQKIGEGVYGKSITDPCLGWAKTERLIYDIAEMHA